MIENPELNPAILKFQVTIHFNVDATYMSLIPTQRTYVDTLINKGVIDSYSVSLETMRSWMIINACSKQEVELHLSLSPQFKYWHFEIDELYVFDGQNYRLPGLQLN